MSKRWKVRKANAAKRERAREALDQFYANVIERLKAMPPAERERLLQAANQH